MSTVLSTLLLQNTKFDVFCICRRTENRTSYKSSPGGCSLKQGSPNPSLQPGAAPWPWRDRAAETDLLPPPTLPPTCTHSMPPACTGSPPTCEHAPLLCACAPLPSVSAPCPLASVAGAPRPTHGLLPPKLVHGLEKVGNHCSKRPLPIPPPQSTIISLLLLNRQMVWSIFKFLLSLE